MSLSDSTCTVPFKFFQGKRIFASDQCTSSENAGSCQAMEDVALSHAVRLQEE